jgi:hypothetical protein
VLDSPSSRPDVSGAFDPHAIWSVSDAFDSPSICLESLRHVDSHSCCLKRVKLTLTTSGASQMRWGRLHAVWSLADALESPSRHLEFHRRVGTALTPSGTLGIAFTPSEFSRRFGTHPGRLGSTSHFPECSRRIRTAVTPSGVSQMRWNRPHAVWDTRVCLHAFRNVPDALGPPSCHLGYLGSPSRRMECPRRIEIVLTLPGLLVTYIPLSSLFLVTCLPNLA